MTSSRTFRALALAVLVAATGGAAPTGAAANAPSRVSALVQLTPLRKGTLPKLVKGFGRVAPAEAAKTAIAADVAGVVTSVNVYQGEFVRKGTAILTIAPSAEASSAYKQAQLSVRFARRLLDATRSLMKAHLKTRSDLAKQQQALATAQLKLEALRQIGADGPRTIVAPHDAIVLALNAGPGSAVSKGAQLAALADPSDLLLDAEIPPGQTHGIGVGNGVRIVATDSGETFRGKVVSKGGVISASGGLGRVQVSVPPGKMMIGEHAMALIAARRVSGYLVPHAAILVNDGGGTYVVQSVHLTAHLVPVDVLASNGKQDIVRGKLVPGADVVLSGNHQAQEGMALRIEAADAATAAKVGSD